jgi:hypothetical protein
VVVMAFGPKAAEIASLGTPEVEVQKKGDPLLEQRSLLS